MIADPCVSICADRCAEFGDPPCYTIWRETKLGLRGLPWEPCDDCLHEAGIEVVDRIDPTAVIAPLL